MDDARESLPLTLVLAAGIIALLAVQQLWLRGIPAFAAADPEAFGELLDVFVYLLIAGGLVARQRWAWWLAVTGATASCVIPAAVLGSWDALELASEFDDPDAMVQAMTIIGVAAFALLVLLFARSTRDAVRR